MESNALLAVSVKIMVHAMQQLESAFALLDGR